MWCASDFLLVKLLLSISISISQFWLMVSCTSKKNTTCSNDLPMLALEFTKGATKSEASTRTSKIPPRPRRNSYLNHWESTYAIISLSWREFFLICIVPVKTFHCLLHLFALFTKFRIRSWFLLLDYQSFFGKAQKPKNRFAIHAWTSETWMPSWSQVRQDEIIVFLEESWEIRWEICKVSRYHCHMGSQHSKST